MFSFSCGVKANSNISTNYNITNIWHRVNQGLGQVSACPLMVKHVLYKKKITSKPSRKPGWVSYNIIQPCPAHLHTS